MVPVASGAPARSVPQMAIAGEDLVLVWTEAQEVGKRIASGRIPVDSITPDLRGAPALFQRVSKAPGATNETRTGKVARC